MTNTNPDAFFIAIGPFSCNFENDLCKWTQSSSDHFNWTHHQGYTSSSGTGPSFDHTRGQGEICLSAILTRFSKMINNSYCMAQVTSGIIARCDWLPTWQDMFVMTARINEIVNFL